MGKAPKLCFGAFKNVPWLQMCLQDKKGATGDSPIFFS